jgi:hypothetical protein
VSIIRIGLGENKKYGAGWDSIFGGSPAAGESKEEKPTKKKGAKAAAKRPAAKKKAGKKK